MQLNLKALFLAGGLTWGLCVLFMSYATLFGWTAWQPFVQGLSVFYLGYDSTYLGGLIGFVWGFFDLGIGALIFGALYNFFARK